MKKEIEQWSVQELRKNYSQIDFPEYQREPNLWSRVEKQRLLDSMIRQFDIASLYFYRHEDGSIDCVDGRQRIGAIMSFLGENPVDKDAKFRFKCLNEIYDDSEFYQFRHLDDKTFSDIDRLSRESQDPTATEFIAALLCYPLTVVMLSDSERPDEFNLQFTRLNLGTIINSGEKLHAMVGALRDECFCGLGRHLFLQKTNIPTRRFAREQVAAQIVAQIFSLSVSGEYARTRHFDLQRLFKQNSTLSSERSELIDKLRKLFDLLLEPFGNLNILRNRAITVSTVLLAWKMEVTTEEAASKLAKFVEEFVSRLKWQVKKGVLVDQEYHYLMEFQQHITQASAESYSVEGRAKTLEEEFQRWRADNELRGDAEWKKRNPHLDPCEESRN